MSSQACVWVYEKILVVISPSRFTGNGQLSPRRYLRGFHSSVVLIRFVELPLGQELPDYEALAHLFADSPGSNRPVETYEDMPAADSNLNRLIPDTYTSGTAAASFASFK